MNMLKNTFVLLMVLSIFLLVGCSREEKTIPIDYVVKENNSFFLEGITRVDSYKDYEELPEAIISNTNYDEEFFKDSNLIFYGIKEASSSHKIEISKVILYENFDISLSINREIPKPSNGMIKDHQFVIEYIKPIETVQNVDLKITNISEVTKEFSLLKTGDKEIKRFIKNNEIKKVEVRVFTKDIQKYGLDQMNGEMTVSKYTPLVIVSLDSAKDIDYDKLSKITDDNIDVYINITYIEKEIIE